MYSASILHSRLQFRILSMKLHFYMGWLLAILFTAFQVLALDTRTDPLSSALSSISGESNNCIIDGVSYDIHVQISGNPPKLLLRASGTKLQGWVFLLKSTRRTSSMMLLPPMHPPPPKSTNSRPQWHMSSPVPTISGSSSKHAGYHWRQYLR